MKIVALIPNLSFTECLNWWIAFKPPSSNNDVFGTYELWDGKFIDLKKFTLCDKKR